MYQYITRPLIYILLILSSAIATHAHSTKGTEHNDTTDSEVHDLDEFVLTQKVDSRRKLKGSAMNSELLTSAEIKRAACCNLGESFTTNPSVDVNYSDAATGAKQIRLLGLPGTYVQMLTENVPNLRGASAPFGLGYIPGPWMQSIQVSKGASSVKNGYESVTGQINVEFLKPQADQSFSANVYADHLGKVETNLEGNMHLSPEVSSGLLVHGEKSFMAHDSNEDGFADSPKISQVGVMNRWAWITDKYILQCAAKYLGGKRESGQISHGDLHSSTPYLVNILTNRGEAWLKNAYIFDPENGGNIALILSGSIHGQRNTYGARKYDVNQRNFYASLMFERDFGSQHSLSAGISFNTDAYNQSFIDINGSDLKNGSLFEHENTSGAYAQYTFDLDKRLILMAGLRYDYSSLYGSMFTPRVHARWNPKHYLTFHISAGKGYRTPFALADNSYLLASSREIIVSYPLEQEEAWNFGGGISGDFRFIGKKFTWGGEYYYTHFIHQAIVDLDSSPMAAYILNLPGKSFSHAAQVELSCEPFENFTVMAAYRFTDVRLDYGRGLVQKPLSSRSKALFSINYAPMMGLWQFDATLAITGKGRMPDAPTDNGVPRWDSSYKAFPTLNLQATRNFRHWSLYIGGENLTNYKQHNPIIGASNPWGSTFDATMIYAPVHGAMIYAGFRYTFTKY